MAQRKLTPQELAEIDAAGYDVSSIVDKVVEVPDEQFSAGQAYGRNLATSALPAVGGGVGAGLGMKGGAIAGAEIGAFFGPAGVPIGGAIGAVAGGLAGGFAGSKLTSVAQEEFIPEETKQATALASQQHPTAAMLGGLSAMPLGGMMPTPSGIGNALGGAGKLAAYGANRVMRPVVAGVESSQPILNAMEKQALINSAVGAGLGPINEAVTAKMEGRDVTAKDLALSSAIGAAFNSPTPVIGRAMGFHMPPTPQLQTEAGFRRAFAVPAESTAPTMEPTELPLRLPVQEQINQAAGIVTANEKVPLLNADGTPKLDDKGKPLTMTQPKPSKKAQESAAAIAQAESEGRPVVSRIDESVITAANEAAAKKKAALAKQAVPSPDILVDVVKEELAKTNPAAYSQRWNELLPQLKEVGLTDDALALMQKEVFGPKGLNLKVGAKLPEGVVGRFNPETPTDIEVGKGAGPAIPAHEGFHEQWSKMTSEERARWKAATADELAAVNAERMKENKPAYDEEEWFAMQGSVEFLSRGLNTRKEGTFKKWLEDTKSIMKQQFGKDVTAEDLLRAHNYRLMNESRGVKPMVSVGKGEEKSATADENLGAEYNQLQLALKDKSVPFQEKMSAWKRIEEIKNANKGMPPGKESGETVEINPNWREDQREDMQGLYGKDRYATTDENLGGSNDPEVLAALNKKRYLSQQLARKVSPEDAKLTIDQLKEKYNLSERTLYRRISSGLPLDAVVAKGRKSATEALGLNLQDEVVPVEGATEGGPEVKAVRRPASELGEEFVDGGKFNENARAQVANKVEQRVRGLLAKRGMAEIPSNLDLKAITDLVIADMENYGMEPYSVKDIYARNLPHTLAGKPNFRKTVEMRTDMYAQREVRDFLKTAENTRYSIDKPVNESGETIAANLPDDGTFPTEFLSDTPPEEVHGTDLATRAKQNREDFIEPPSEKELYEDTLPDEELQARKDAELEAAQHVPEKKTRTKEYQFKATETVPRKDLIHTNMLALEAKRAELKALKGGMSLGLFRKNFIEKNRMLKVAGLKLHPAEDALQTHYRHAFEEASQYSDMGKYESLNPREAKAARQRLINIIESDIEAIKLMQQDLLFRADVPVNLKEFAAKYAEIHAGAGKVDYNPIRDVVPAKIEEQPRNVIQSRQGKTYGQTPELTGPAKQPITAKPTEYVMYDDNTNTTKRVQSQEEVAALKKEGYRLLRSNTGEEVGSRFATAEENIGGQTNTPEFKEWFGESKVVDGEGKPLVVYHGTNAKDDFFIFNTKTGRTLGTHFGTEAAAKHISGRKQIPVYLSIKNPFNWDRVGRKEHGFFSDNLQNIAHDVAEQTYYHEQVKQGSKSVSFGKAFDNSEIGKLYKQFYDDHEKIHYEGLDKADKWGYVSEENKKLDAQLKHDSFVAFMDKLGYDGISYINVSEDAGHRSYIAFYPEQIKSATGNSGAFDKNNPDIRFATAEENIGARRSFFKPFEAAADRLVDVDPRLGKAFRRWDVQKDIYEGWGNEAIHDLSKFDTEDVNKVAAIHRDAFRNGKPLPSLSGKEKEISQILINYYHDDVGMERNRLGMKIGGKAGSLTPSYVPDMLSPTAIDLLVNKATTPAGIKAANDWANHIVKESAGKITLPEATEYVDQYTRAMGSGKDNNYLSVEFGALRKAEGYGVPDSLRETDAVAALSRYARRAATDMAMFKEMQVNKEIGAMLGLKDDTGKTITSPGIKPLDKDRRVQDAMKFVTGNYASGKAALNSPRLTAVSRLVNNLILGPATGLRDTASVPVNMLPYINRFSDLSAAWSGVMDLRKNSREAIRYGATKPSVDKIQFADVMTSPDKLTEVLRKAATFARVLQGRETIENFNRDLTFSIGKELARSNVLGAKSGNAKSKLFVKNFGELVEGDVTKLSGADLEEALNIMAKNFVDRNQGSYGVRGLPTGMVDSQFAPFLALQKWSTEKSNVIYKDVIAPFVSGENRLPLITYTLGSVLTGAAIQQLNQVLSGRKSQDPQLKEVLAKGDVKDYVAQLATLMQLGSYAGIVSDGMKAGADMVAYGKTPRNLASFPTASLAMDLQEKIADVAEAMKQGEDPFKVFSMFATDVISQNVQAARMVANRTINENKVERSDKFRDLRVFKQMEGGPNADFPKVNPYLGIDSKKFKRTDDLNEAMGLVPSLLKRAMEQSGGNPEELKKKLAGLKGMSYNTMPNMNTQPQEFQDYYKYLVDTQGQEEADTRMADFLRQSASNKMKSSMFPSL
jgi:hypothetical protein